MRFNKEVKCALSWSTGNLKGVRGWVTETSALGRIPLFVDWFCHQQCSFKAIAQRENVSFSSLNWYQDVLVALIFSSLSFFLWKLSHVRRFLPVAARETAGQNSQKSMAVLGQEDMMGYFFKMTWQNNKVLGLFGTVQAKNWSHFKSADRTLFFLSRQPHCQENARRYRCNSSCWSELDSIYCGEAFKALWLFLSQTGTEAQPTSSETCVGDQLSCVKMVYWDFHIFRAVCLLVD